MRTARQHFIDQTILRALERAGGYPVPDKVLQMDVDLHVVPPMRRAEFDDAIRFLESEARITSITSDTGPKWSLTDKGRAHLAGA